MTIIPDWLVLECLWILDFVVQLRVMEVVAAAAAINRCAKLQLNSVTTNKPTPNFLQVGYPCCHPNNSVKALKGILSTFTHQYCPHYHKTFLCHYHKIMKIGNQNYFGTLYFCDFPLTVLGKLRNSCY